jgi:hypothetical protein
VWDLKNPTETVRIRYPKNGEALESKRKAIDKASEERRFLIFVETKMRGYVANKLVKYQLCNNCVLNKEVKMKCSHEMTYVE